MMMGDRWVIFFPLLVRKRTKKKRECSLARKPHNHCDYHARARIETLAAMEILVRLNYLFSSAQKPL